VAAQGAPGTASGLGVPRDAKAKPGTLLVINGAGGVGSILVQMARRLAG
jgi:NADPH:quinone reductase-like Zn-dependent oxidoreductase